MRRLLLTTAIALFVALGAGLSAGAESASAARTYCGAWKNHGYAYFNSGYRSQQQKRSCADTQGHRWTQYRTISHHL